MLLCEASRQSLYHWTTMYNGVNIVLMNILAKRVEVFDLYTGVKLKKPIIHSGYVSFTRNPRYKVRGNYDGEICFEVDWDKIKTRYKTRPKADRFTLPASGDKGLQGTKGEFEEKVKGPIKNLDTYIKTIWIVPEVMKKIKNYLKNPPNPESAKEYKKFLLNNKIKVGKP